MFAGITRWDAAETLAFSPHKQRQRAREREVSVYDRRHKHLPDRSDECLAEVTEVKTRLSEALNKTEPGSG